MLQTILQKWLLVALFSWAPVRDHVGEKEPDVVARYESVADDIALVSLDPSESPLPGKTRAETAAVLGNVASLEGHMWKFVDDGSCNDPAKRADPRGNCDGRHACSLWQIHPDALPLGEHATCAELIADRKKAIRIALHIMQISIKRTGTLCMYTGESCRGPHKLADERLNRGLDWVKAHPFTGGESSKTASLVP